MSLNYNTPERPPLRLVEDKFTCHYCDGEGRYELFGEYAPCDACDGIGKVTEDNTPKVLLGIVTLCPSCEQRHCDCQWDEAEFYASMEQDRQQGWEPTPWHCC